MIFTLWVKEIYTKSTIRAKLAFQFTMIFALILILVFVAVFELTSLSRNVAFKNQLKDRAVTAAEVFLAYDNTSRERFVQIQKDYLDRLPSEAIRVYDYNNKAVFLEDNPRYWNRGYVERVRFNKELFFRVGKRECYGIFYHDNQGNYVVISSAIDLGSQQRLNSLKLVLLITFIISLLLVYFVGKWFASEALKPISNVIEQVQGISASNLHLRVSEGNTKDEIGALALTFNHLLSRLERSFDMQRAFVSNASHELRTPITSLIGEIEVTLTRNRTTEEYQAVLESLLIQSEKLNEITNSMLDLAQASSNPDVSESVRIDELFWDLKEYFAARDPHASVDVIMQRLPLDQAELEIPATKRLLFIAFANIISNAIKYSGDKKATCMLEFNNGNLSVSISDKGIGMDRDTTTKVFQPFFRAENARAFSGQGIGLSISEKIIHLYRGVITVESKLNYGTTFSVKFLRV